MLLPRRRLETRIETHPRPLLLEGRVEVPSNKRGFRGVYTVIQKTKLLPKNNIDSSSKIFLSATCRANL